jgi:hypothetical protein
MAKEYVLLEEKSLENNGLVVVSKDFCTPEVAQVFNVAGNLKGVGQKDFRHDDHFCFDFLPVVPLSSFKQPTKEEVEAVQQNLRFTGSGFDLEGLASSQKVINEVLNFQMLSGELYLLRFDGREVRSRKPIVRSNLYFLPENGPELTFKRGKLRFGSEVVEEGGDLEYVRKSDSYEGEVTLRDAGSAKLHRKMLRPYLSKGRFGSTHSNGPWALLQDEPFDKTSLSIMRSQLERRLKDPITGPYQ